MTKSEAAAKSFIEVVKANGWEIDRVCDGIVTISKHIGRDNRDEFVKADSEYYYILEHAPLRGGSVWGTDGGGIGALSAMRSGRFVMNKSGDGKRFISALMKMMGR